MACHFSLSLKVGTFQVVLKKLGHWSMHAFSGAGRDGKKIKENFNETQGLYDFRVLVFETVSSEHYFMDIQSCGSI